MKHVRIETAPSTSSFILCISRRPERRRPKSPKTDLASEVRAPKRPGPERQRRLGRTRFIWTPSTGRRVQLSDRASQHCSANPQIRRRLLLPIKYLVKRAVEDRSKQVALSGRPEVRCHPIHTLGRQEGIMLYIVPRLLRVAGAIVVTLAVGWDGDRQGLDKAPPRHHIE
jgi:hypothetical protein